MFGARGRGFIIGGGGCIHFCHLLKDGRSLLGHHLFNGSYHILLLSASCRPYTCSVQSTRFLGHQVLPRQHPSTRPGCVTRPPNLLCHRPQILKESAFVKDSLCTATRLSVIASPSRTIWLRSITTLFTIVDGLLLPCILTVDLLLVRGFACLPQWGQEENTDQHSPLDCWGNV